MKATRSDLTTIDDNFVRVVYEPQNIVRMVASLPPTTDNLSVENIPHHSNTEGRDDKKTNANSVITLIISAGVSRRTAVKARVTVVITPMTSSSILTSSPTIGIIVIIVVSVIII